jgi:glycosyltransferase involved in cell wall biosynthesis
MFNPQLASLGHYLSRLGLPYIVCPHDPYHPALLAKRRFLKAIYKPVERYVLNSSVAIQVLSSRHIEHLQRFGVIRPAFVVPNGFDHKEAVLPTKQSAGRTPSRSGVRLLFLGRIDMHHKGLDLLIDALARIQRSYGPFAMPTVTIMGVDWGDRKRLQALARRRGISNHVHFAGPDYKRNPLEIISEYDLLMLPSRYDGFGFTVLEAMLAEVPVIVSREAGIAEHVMKAGCGLVCCPDSDSLASAIVEAISRKDEWRDMGKRGRQYAFQNLSWDEIGKKALEIYSRITVKN